jgi:hypothetical protein
MPVHAIEYANSSLDEETNERDTYHRTGVHDVITPQLSTN